MTLTPGAVSSNPIRNVPFPHGLRLAHRGQRQRHAPAVVAVIGHGLLCRTEQAAIGGVRLGDHRIQDGDDRAGVGTSAHASAKYRLERM